MYIKSGRMSGVVIRDPCRYGRGRANTVCPVFAVNGRSDGRVVLRNKERADDVIARVSGYISKYLFDITRSSYAESAMRPGLSLT